MQLRSRFRRLAILPLFVVAAAPIPNAPPLQLANSTFVINRNSQNFQVGLDPEMQRSGAPTMLLQSTTKQWGVFGTALRAIDPALYRGKRVRFSCQVKSANLANWGGLLFFAQGQDGTILAHDDSGGRPIVKSAEWREVEVVAEIPQGTAVLQCGLQLHGAGKLWLDSAKFEIVGDDIAITDDRAWHAWSFSAPHYTQILDDTVQRNGHPTVCLSSTSAGKGEFCDYEHVKYDIDKYRGKAIRMTAWIRTENVSAASGLALRCRGKNWRNLGADIGDKERAIKGTSGWKQYELIASVPPEADMIRSGVRLCGKGKLWVDDIKYEIVE